MDVVPIFGKFFLLILPLLVFGFMGYTEWRKHYEGGLLGYYFRAATGRKLKQDNRNSVLIKAAVVVGWFFVMSDVLFP